MAGGARYPRGAAGRVPLARSRSSDPDPGAMDMGPVGAAYAGPTAGPSMGVAAGYAAGFGPGYAAGYGPAYATGYPLGYGPGYPYQHHHQLVHRPHAASTPGAQSQPSSSKCGSFWRFVWKLSSCLCSHVTLVSLVIAYCLLGAMTFEMLEKDNELRVSGPWWSLAKPWPL